MLDGGAVAGSRARVIAVVVAGLAVALAACGSTSPGTRPMYSSSTDPEVSPMATSIHSPSPVALALTSAAFAEGGAIPREHSCHGLDVSPQLAWRGVPAGTAALVLFVDDPDGRDWVHWSVLDLPGADGELPRGVLPSAEPPQQGRNDFGRVGYGGPCPPSGTHHYRFTLYALAAPLGLPGHPEGPAVRRALERVVVLARVTLTGTFAA